MKADGAPRINDLKALLDNIADVCHVTSIAKSIADFLRDLPTMEGQIPASALEVAVFRQEQALYLAIRNTP